MNVKSPALQDFATGAENTTALTKVAEAGTVHHGGRPRGDVTKDMGKPSENRKTPGKLWENDGFMGFGMGFTLR